VQRPTGANVSLGCNEGDSPMRTTTLHLALGASLVCLAARSGQAQEASAADASPVAAASDSQLSEVVVTAERRSENLQNVPIAVSVLSADDAAKLGNYDNMSLGSQVPSFQASRQLTGATLYLRGVGTISAPGGENAVASYIDDVYVNGMSGTIVPFDNVERVEVLKGPQGTLFGRNATGGVINTITRDPSTEQSVSLKVGYANYDTFSSTFYGTTGLGQNLAIDLSAQYREQNEGYGRNVFLNKDIWLGKEYGLRSKLKWTPGEGTAVTLSVDHYFDDYDYAINANVMPDTLSAGGATFAGDYNSVGNHALTADNRAGHGRNVNGVTLTARHDFGWGSLKSISARRQVTDSTFYDQDMGPGHVVDANWVSKLEQYSQEFHVASPDGAQIGGRDLNWLAGVYLFRMIDGVRPLQIAGAAVAGLDYFGATSVSYTKSYAAFVDGNYALTDKTKLTLGVRETADRITNRGYITVGAGGVLSITDLPEQEANATKPTYRAVLDHAFTDDLMAYVSVSRGFKSGGFSLFAAGTPPVEPEILDAVAVGMKSDWFGHRFQANLEGFYYDYKNQQVQVIRAAGAFSVNAAQSRIYGLEASLTAVASRDLTLRANLGYLHGRYRDFRDAPIYLQNPATCDPTPRRLPGPLTPGSTQCAIDASGLDTVRSPTFSGNVSFDYVMARTTAGNLEWVTNYFYTTEFSWDPSGQYPEPAYGLLNTSLIWAQSEGRYDVQLFCNNCTNKYHNAFIAESGPSIQRAGTEPRTYGLRLAAYF
jgi:iron complex outermembrane recepter protein